MILASYTRLDNNTLLSLYPRIYILFYTDSMLMMFFPNLLSNIYSVFPSRLFIIAKGTRLNKKQIRITPGFAYTEYRVRGVTFKSGVLDLKCKANKLSTESYKRFYSTYIQLFRV